jgi:hypothetical protein
LRRLITSAITLDFFRESPKTLSKRFLEGHQNQTEDHELDSVIQYFLIVILEILFWNMNIPIFLVTYVNRVS